MASKSYPRPGYAGGSLTPVEHERLVHASAPDGVWGHPNDPLPIVADNTGPRRLRVRAGLLAWSRGSAWESGSEDFYLPSLAENNSGFPRIDVVVLRLDRSDYSLTEHVITGVPGANPSAPALTLNPGPAGFYDLPMVDVRVPHGATTLASDAVTRRCWYVGSDGQLLCTASTRPPNELGRRIYQTDTAQGLVYAGSRWMVYAEDTGWVNLAVAKGWTRNTVRIRRFNGTAHLHIDMTRTGASLAPRTTTTLFNLDTAYLPSSGHHFTPTVIYHGMVGRIAILANGAVQLSNHEGVSQNRYLVASTSWPVG